MKVAYKHLVSCIPSKPSIDEISEKFFQLGHEHEIENEIFNMDLTPNRGDCLSIHGLVRDLAPFYDVDLTCELYKKELKKLDLNFVNNAPKACPHISFLKIDIEGEIAPYSGKLEEYFKDLDINKNNFFTDISNYISYERGQPTHCYDSKKIKNLVTLDFINNDKSFNTLLDKKIALTGKNLVFLQDGEVINLAGIMGDKNTSCSNDTRSVIIECASFNPEEIIGKSVKYDIKSDAAHKFERGVDPLCHQEVLRRFIYIVSNHANIKNIEIYNDSFAEYCPTKIQFDHKKISNILGIVDNKKVFEKHLLKLGFRFLNNEIIVPSYRNDVKNLNDIAEEIARVIGYNNIPSKSLELPSTQNVIGIKKIERYLKDSLIKNGFYEVINNPFVNTEEVNAIKVDNPLDSNKQHIRTNLQKSLLENLLYNERRQQESIKLFEISNVYHTNDLKSKKVLGIICSGRINKNYLEFSQKINKKYLQKILDSFDKSTAFQPINIARDYLDTKIKNEIIYIEIDISDLKNEKPEVENNKDINLYKYLPISDFPLSSRDLSFSVKSPDSFYLIQEKLLNYSHKLLKEVFIFDFYKNEKLGEIKIGFRFVFQSKKSTITDKQVNEVIENIIGIAKAIDSVEIPGLK